MPAASIQTTYNRVIGDIAVLERYRIHSQELPVKFQHFVAEVILLRLFSLIENTIKDTALKLACNVPYRNGNHPVLLHISRNMIDAENNFKTFGRGAHLLRQLKWTVPVKIHESVENIMLVNENFRVQITINSNQINEIRKVRNHIAHRTTSTRREYRQVILANLGANLRIQPGAYLTSNRFAIPKIDYYLNFSRAFIDNLTNG